MAPPYRIREGNPVDKAWFLDAMREKSMNIQALAEILDVRHSTLSRSLSGQRRFTTDEIDKIAGALGRSREKIAQKVGEIRRPDIPEDISIKFVLDGQGTISAIEPTSLPKDLKDRARAVLNAAQKSDWAVAAIVAKNKEDTWHHFDRGIIVWAPTNSIQRETTGVLCVVKVSETPVTSGHSSSHQKAEPMKIAGRTLVATVRALRLTGEAELTLLSGRHVEARIESASPILSIIP